MNCISILLIISILSKHVIRNSRLKISNHEKSKVQLDLGDILLVLILILEKINLIEVGELYKLNLKALFKMMLAVISIIFVNRISLITFIKRLKYFKGSPQISAGGVHHLIKEYKGARFFTLSLITTASGPFLEELIFRSGLTLLLSRFLAGNCPLFVQSLIFGLVHGVPIYLGGADARTALVCFIVTTLDGLILGYLFSIYGILASWLCHWCVNFIALITYNFNKSINDRFQVSCDI